MCKNCFPVTCDVCGGTGFGSIKTAAAGWDATVRVVHGDPLVCREILDARRREEESK